MRMENNETRIKWTQTIYIKWKTKLSKKFIKNLKKDVLAMELYELCNFSFADRKGLPIFFSFSCQLFTVSEVDENSCLQPLVLLFAVLVISGSVGVTHSLHSYYVCYQRVTVLVYISLSLVINRVSPSFIHLKKSFWAFSSPIILAFATLSGLFSITHCPKLSFVLFDTSLNPNTRFKVVILCVFFIFFHKISASSLLLSINVIPRGSFASPSVFTKDRTSRLFPHSRYVHRRTELSTTRALNLKKKKITSR